MNTLQNSTLKNFKNYLKLKNYCDNTIILYSCYLEKFILFTNKSALHLTSNDIELFMNSYNFKSISQQNQFISVIKIFYEKILKKKFVKHDFKRPRKEKHLPQIIDKQHLLDSIYKIQNLKHKAIITLAYSVGLRVSEVCNLKISDIDSKRMIININQAKGKKDRIVPLSENVLKLLRQYYIEFKPKDYLFNGQNKPQYTPSSCNKIVKNYIGKEFHFHLLRHTCFTNLLENKTDLRIIQKIAGHASSKTTEIYTHVSVDLLKTIELPI